MSAIPLPNEKDLKRRYGLTLGQYVELLDAQGGVCAVCGKPPTERTGPLVVDHDHDPPYPVDGLVHGNPCNRRLTQQVRHYLADPPGRRFGWTVPPELEAKTITRREAGKVKKRADRAAAVAEERREQERRAAAAADFERRLAAIYTTPDPEPRYGWTEPPRQPEPEPPPRRWWQRKSPIYR
jgi:hypothetical protein